MLILERPWYSQPQGEVVASEWARSNKIRVLVSADPQFDAVSGSFTAATIATGTISLVPTAQGRAFSQTGASSVNSVGDLLLRNSWTVLMLAAPLAVNTHSAIRQRGVDEQQIGFNFNDQFSITGAAGRFSVTLLQAGVNRSHAYVAGAADGNPHAFLMRKNGAAFSAWIDGVSRPVVSSGGFTGAPGAATDTINLCGSNIDGARSWTGGSSISCMALLQVALTDSECAALSRAPAAWGLFEPRRIYIPVAAGGGSPAVCLLSDGSLAYKTSAGGTDRKVYWTTASRLEAKLTAGAGDKLLTMAGGQLQAT